MQLVKCVLVATTPEATHSPRELFIIGGQLALDFANTVDDPDGPNHHDHAGTYAELASEGFDVPAELAGGYAAGRNALAGLAAGELLTSPQLSRLKKCAGCPWLFLDQSKNLSRRWCT